MKQVLLVLMFFISFSSHALVGDETCMEWSHYSQTKTFAEHTRDKGFLNYWNCSTPNGSGHSRNYHCNRKLRKCVKWSPSPSEHIANQIAEKFSKKIAEQIKQTNSEMNDNYAKDTFEIISDYTSKMSDFLGNVISTLKDKTESKEQ